MSFLNRIRPCPCRSWRCRAHYAARVLLIAGGIAMDLFMAAKSGLI